MHKCYTINECHQSCVLVKKNVYFLGLWDPICPFERPDAMLYAREEQIHCFGTWMLQLRLCPLPLFYFALSLPRPWSLHITPSKCRIDESRSFKIYNSFFLSLQCIVITAPPDNWTSHFKNKLRRKWWYSMYFKLEPSFFQLCLCDVPSVCKKYWGAVADKASSSKIKVLSLHHIEAPIALLHTGTLHQVLMIAQ